jgi:hypothetical protein
MPQDHFAAQTYLIRHALVGGHQGREILLVRHHQLEPFAQHLRPLLAGLGARDSPGKLWLPLPRCRRSRYNIPKSTLEISLHEPFL